MVTDDQMLQVLASMMPDPQRLISDPNAAATIDREAKRIMSAGGIDPDGVFKIGNVIMRAAVEQRASPEDAVVGAFATGVAMTIGLFHKGLLQAP